MVSAEVRAGARLTVGRILTNQARIRADDVAVAEGQASLTYRELDAHANRVAAALRATGVETGDRLAVLSGNSLEYLVVLCAAAKLGVAVAGLNWRLHPGEIREAIDVIEPALFFASHEHRQRLIEAVDGMASPAEIMCLEAESCEHEHSYRRAIAGEDSEPPDIEVDPEAVLSIVFTSGTTGAPKGAAISHRALLARAAVGATELGLSAEDTFVCWPPMFHMAGTDWALVTLILGGKVVVLPGFVPEAIVEHVVTETIGWLVLVPGTYERFLDALRADPRPVHNVKLVGGMADLVPPEQIAELTSALDAPFYNSFGCTEAGSVPGAGVIPVGVAPEDLSKLQSSLVDVRLVDEEDRDVADGEPGELLVRGPTLFSGYWMNEAATDHAFRGGWYHTGDVVRREPDGRLSFASRSKYLIKSGAENIYPGEVERVLLRHPDVEEAVVIRQPDAHWGEVPVAVVTRTSGLLSEPDLIEYCRSQIARYKVPKRIVFLDADDFPRNLFGKIVREELEQVVSTKATEAVG